MTAKRPWSPDSRSCSSTEVWQYAAPRMSSMKHRYPIRRLVLATGLLLMLSLLSGCLSFHRGPLPGEPKGAYQVAGGVRLRYTDVQPSGGPTRGTVVLLHGFASSLDTWNTVAPALVKSGHRVLALDLKGFGWSERPAGDYSPEAQAKLVLALMDERGIRDAAVVGHSWGASVALATALVAPERVTRLALYDAWVYEEQLPSFLLWSRASGVGEVLFGLWYGERVDERLALAFYDRRYVTEQLVEDVEKALERPGTRAAALAASRGQRFRRMQEKYRDIEQPTLLLWGREDGVAALSMGERLSRDLPNAKLEVYPRCGHFPMIEATTESTRDLCEFLAVDRRRSVRTAGASR